MPRARVDLRLTFPQALKLSLFLGGSLLAATVFLLAHWAIDRLSREVASTSAVLARFCAQASFPATRDPEMSRLVSDLIAGIDFPIIVTDKAGLPRAWKAVHPTPEQVPDASLDSLASHLTVSPVIAARVERIRRRAHELDHLNAPIAMTRELLLRDRTGIVRIRSADTLGAVHYGEPRVLDVLRWTPYVSLAGTILLLAIGLGGLTVIRQSERRTIWVGMAKETAHQLATPLSSLMGWSELLRAHVPDPPRGDVRLPAEELAETVSEIERDVERLRKVAERFSNVGSEPRLTRQNPADIVQDVVTYMRRRLPHTGEVQLKEHYRPTPEVRLNPELLEWALENLVANALTALDKRPGRIEVAVQPGTDGKSVEIAVSDNGRGMTPREQHQAFLPGYSTKRRGWGLGLPLARRVVEDYHGGRLWVRASTPGQGTTMAIRLPAASDAPPRDRRDRTGAHAVS